MKKIFSLMLSLGLFVGLVQGQVASVVTAPNLEKMTSSNLIVQQKGLMQGMQSQINTLNTAKNTFDNLETIKKIDERITKVSATLKQARVIYNIFDLGGQVFTNAKNTNALMVKSGGSVPEKVIQRYLTDLQKSVDQADNIVAVCKDIISQNYKMNDYERLNMLNGYYDKINALNYRLASLHRSFVNIVAINRL